MAGVGSAASSLDINNIVSQLMQVESRRKTLLQRDEASYQVKLSAVGSLSSSMSSFQAALNSLKNASNFQSIRATSGDNAVLTATASSSAAPGTYSLEVTQLAKANMLASSAHTDTTSAIATGTLTIKVGAGAAKDVTIDTSNNTLAGIRDAINKAGADVTASIINDGSGYKLIMTANKMGDANDIKVTVTGDSVGTDTDADGLSSLMYDPVGTKNMTEIQAAKSAILKMGSGLSAMEITKDSNTVTDVIQGVTLNLLKEQVGTPVSITVTNDTSVVNANITKFVGEFNKLVKSLKDIGGYDPTTKKSGPLAGDGMIRQVESQIRSVIAATIPGLSGGVNSLSQIGITTQTDGTLSINSTKLSAALSNNFNDIVKLFATAGTATDANISMSSSTSKTIAGSYAVNITQAATQGKFVGGNISAGIPLAISAGSNDALALSINGIAGSITLSAGTYNSGADLAAELQSKINGVSAFSAAGISATVSYDTGTGKLTITSSTYGSESKISGIIGNAATDLGFDVGTSTDGVDVAGTIGGHSATGSGQKLTGGAGTAVEGLTLTILGSATGDRGTFSFSTGVAETILAKMDVWLDSSSGVIKSKTDSLNSTIKRIQNATEQEDARLLAREKTLRAQFITLQQTLDRLNSVGTFLTNQSAGLENLIKG
ncbi:MAG: flagellar filament capping protein FliD [Nitrospirota bacterium]|nr:flagellar filament capping protein FliD [Nitrospirota bacterium]